MLKKYLVGFTLAEVLITIGVIGIVAALTIPTLIDNYQKKSTANRLKKTYSELFQAVRLAEEENGEFAGWDLSNEEYPTKDLLFDKYLAPHLKCTKEIVSAIDDLVYYSPNGTRELYFSGFNGSSAVYTLLSGVQVMVSRRSFPSSYIRITLLVDLNGYKTLPNRLGRDMFWFVLFPGYGLVLGSADDGEDGSIKRTRDVLLNGPSAQGYNCKNRGFWCAALIQADGWTISKDYPWK